MPCLDSTTYVANNGVNEQKTIREVIALGHGKTYEILSTKPYWNDLMAAYVAEQTDPQGVLEKKIAKAYGVLKRAEWWFNVGMGGMGETHTTEEDFNDAHQAWESALVRHKELEVQRDSLADRMQQAWAELHRHCPYPVRPQGSVLVTMPHSKNTVMLPLFPWPQSEEVREVTTFFTSPEDGMQSLSPVTYPRQTKLTAAYILADTPGLQKVTAVVTKDGCLQLKPRVTFYSVEDWVASLPYVVAGSMTVTLPKPTAGMKQRVQDFAESIDSDPELTLVEKIKAVYAEFGLTSVATLDPETYEPDWTSCASFTPIKRDGVVVGRFAHYNHLELLIVGKTSELIAPCGDVFYVGGKLLNHLDKFCYGNRVFLQLRWKTPKGNRAALFTLNVAV